MFKFKFFVDFEKEEKWLEQMALEGNHLKSVFFSYYFKKKDPENTTIKIDYRHFKTKEDFIDYKTLFEDSGWEHLAGSRNTGFQYFKKVNKNITNEIFSDNTSKAARYKRYANTSLKLAISFLPVLIVFYLTDLIDIEAFVNPKVLYLTPGLWDKTGSSFWSAFLFETPFALMRGFIWAFIPVMMIINLVFAFKSHKLYSEKKINQ